MATITVIFETNKVNTDFVYNLIITPKTTKYGVDSLEETYNRMKMYLQENFKHLIIGYDLHPHKRVLENGLYEVALILGRYNIDKNVMDSYVTKYLNELVEYNEIESYTIDILNSFPCQCEWENGRILNT